MEALTIINKNGCFNCSEHGSVLLVRGKKSVVRVVSVSSHDFLVLKHALMTHTLATSTEAGSIGLNLDNLTCAREKL